MQIIEKIFISDDCCALTIYKEPCSYPGANRSVPSCSISDVSLQLFVNTKSVLCSQKCPLSSMICVCLKAFSGVTKL